MTATSGLETGETTGHAVTRDGVPAHGALRGLLLALLLFSIAGTSVELLLLGHTESIWQWIPLVLFGLGIVACTAVAIRPGPAAINLLRLVMALFVASGLLGLYLHYRGNVEFELEMRPGLEGFELFREAIAGATPSLAPGTMTQFGLLGLALTWRHPALRRTSRRPNNEEEA